MSKRESFDIIIKFKNKGDLDSRQFVLHEDLYKKYPKS